MTTTASPNVHPTAVVHPNAELAPGVQIGPYAVIGEHVRIGEGTTVGPHAVIEGRTTIGKMNRIFQFASLGSLPQDLKYKGEPSTLEIGDANQIREFVTMNPGTEGGGMVTRVGNGNLFMVSVHIAHDCIVGDRNIFANGATLAGHVVVENETIIGGMAGVHQFARVGTGAMMSGGTLAPLDIPPYCIAQGDRAKLFGLNVIGLRRRGVTSEQLRTLKRAYKTVFHEGLRLQEAIEKIRAEYADSELVTRFADFLAQSKRGLTRPPANTTGDEEAPEGLM
jgi:UDP-N-acetylglucosamine acyltransferase